MSRLRSQGGMVLTELLVAMVLLTVLLGATLTTFGTMQKRSIEADTSNELQEGARLVVDRMAIQLRNLASQADNVAHPIERAGPQDLIFLVVRRDGAPSSANPTNIQRVRYCLDNQQRLYQQTQVLGSVTTASPPAAACPASGYTQTQLVSDQIVNDRRVLFRYMLAVPPPQRYLELTSVTDALQIEQIVGIRPEIFFDNDEARAPAETTLSTRVFLRNQNRKPSAVFSATPFTGMAVQLNGSESEDPEGGRLTFEWFDDAVLGTNKKIGEGSVFVATLTAGTHQLWLRVTDPAGNATTTEKQNFTCQPTTGCVTS